MEQTVYKVYSGKAGKCMCGCAGKYSYTADGAYKHNPGYDVSEDVNERSVKIIANKVFRSADKVVETGLAYVERNGRIIVAFFEEE